MFWCDDSRAPLIIQEFRGALSLDDVRLFADFWAARFANGERTGAVVGAKDVPMPSLATLKQLAAWVDDNRSQLQACSVGFGMCIDSAVVRGAVRFINTLTPPPIPQAVFATQAEAIAWVTERLEQEGVRILHPSQAPAEVG